MWDIFKPPKINKQTRHLNKTKEITKKKPLTIIIFCLFSVGSGMKIPSCPR